MKEDAPCRAILFHRANTFYDNRASSKLNVNDSPIFEIFNVAERLNLLDTCFNMIMNGHMYSKKEWSKAVWEKAWVLEDEEYQISKGQMRNEKLLYKIIEKPYYLTWWVMSDISRTCIDQFEIMARLVCDSSLLKAYNIK